ncbi:MAG: TetR/AcrR family transcriptional repressor of nem operon [Sulfurimonas sp.]|jgi:TetR/AcrR family transcriptional repressor of nem operon
MNDVRTRLIDATFEEVFTNGYNGSSLANILKTAAVKKGGMYHYFPSKKEMVISMIEEKLQLRLENKWKKLENIDTNIIDSFIESLLDIDNWNLKDGCPLGNLLQEPLKYDRDFASILSTIVENWKKQFIRILQRAKERKELNGDVNIEECSTFLIASIEGALLLAKKYDDTTNFQACMNQLTFYINTLRNH